MMVSVAQASWWNDMGAYIVLAKKYTRHIRESCFLVPGSSFGAGWVVYEP